MEEEEEGYGLSQPDKLSFLFSQLFAGSLIYVRAGA